MADKACGAMFGMSTISVKFSGMKFLLKLAVNGLSVFAAAAVLPGVHVDDYFDAIIVAVILSVLNAILRPILVVLTIPITIVTFGLFLLVINAGIIMLADWLLSDFYVNGFWWALLFSFILAIINSFLDKMIFPKEPRRS